MNDTYVEWMVKRKTSVAMKFLKMLLIILTVMIGLLAMVAFNGNCDWSGSLFCFHEFRGGI